MDIDTWFTCSETINKTCWDKRVQELNKNDALVNAPIILMMILFMVVGLTGNTLVLFVYGKRGNKTSAILFILLLAIMDLIACAILHPYVLYKLFHPHNQTWEITCKLFEFFIHWNLSLSGLSLLLIAIDRYLAICHPLKYLKFDDHEDTHIKRVLGSFIHHLFYLNNAANPIIYTIINRNFRNEW
ncbi:proteinase-activated receptor 3-like [Dreissena polymorpha]|uniref:proteinase-activated receptor 3-like n=1 Tax=Dreissena polymorpha TaxID=45954 RepID=UPI00226417BA|nr:proteinase-activated receptor 3-like [Dreissena polymorpha]